MAVDSARRNGPGFLSLPWDVRSLIYRVLMQVEDLPPESPLDLPLTECLFPFWLSPSSFIHRPPPSVSAFHGLLGSCRQIREEACRLLEQERINYGLKCKMDCMLLRNNEIFTSWTRLPAPVKYLNTLELDLRILTADARGASVGRCSGGFLNDPAFKLAELLEEFFRRGPSYRPTRNLRDDIKIRKVVVNVIDPPEVTGKALLELHGRLLDGSPHPQELFRLLTANYVLQRSLSASIESLTVNHKDQYYKWHIENHIALLAEIPQQKHTRRKTNKVGRGRNEVRRLQEERHRPTRRRG